MKWLAFISIALMSRGHESTGTSDLPRHDINPVVEVPQGPAPTLTAEQENITSSTGPGPKITFENDRFSFGKIYHAEKVTHEFKFVNTGTEDLQIKNVRASCGCTKPTYPTLPIAPGDTSVISVLYNSVGKQGVQKATIHVSTNDPTNPEVKLYLSGRVLVKPLEDK